MGSGSSEFTIREEIERRVITDVTRTELHTQETEEEVNESGNCYRFDSRKETHF